MENRFLSWRYGLFIHYVPELTVDRSGNPVCDINVLADAFDAEGFARDIAAMGAEYIIFTAWHFRAAPLYPSEVTKKYRLPQFYCRRDLLDDLLTACEKYGIPVIFYTHPRAVHLAEEMGGRLLHAVCGKPGRGACAPPTRWRQLCRVH